MKNFLFGIVALVFVVLAIGAYFMVYTVKQTEQAMVLQFGEVKKIVTEPGLHFKLPIQDVEYFDKRVLNFDAVRPELIITADSNRLVVDAFLRYKINNPLLYYQKVKTRYRADNRMKASLNSALREVLGKAARSEIVGQNRGQLMKKIAVLVNKDANKIGINVISVRIKRADLPPNISKDVFNRMKSERQQEAAEFRSRGEEQARRIRARAEADVTIRKANATRDAEIIRGEGDAERNRIFAEVYGKDKDFFAFYRSMKAYEHGLSSTDTRMVITPDSKFFQYFKDPSGQGR